MSVIQLVGFYNFKNVQITSKLSRVWLFATPWTAALQASSVHRILQARILEWVATPFSRGSSQFRDQTPVSRLLHWQTGSLPLAPLGKPRCLSLTHTHTWHAYPAVLSPPAPSVLLLAFDPRTQPPPKCSFIWGRSSLPSPLGRLLKVQTGHCSLNGAPWNSGSPGTSEEDNS